MMLLFSIETVSNIDMACLESCSCPGLNRNDIGLPRPSTRACSLVFNPPRVTPTALDSPFFYHRWHSDERVYRWNRYIDSPYLRRYIVPGIASPALSHLAICKSVNILSSTIRIAPAIPATAHRFERSTSSHLVSYGHPCWVSLVALLVCVADIPRLVPIVHLLTRIFLPCHYFTISAFFRQALVFYIETLVFSLHQLPAFIKKYYIFHSYRQAHHYKRSK